jgi:hypothetical protein
MNHETKFFVSFSRAQKKNNKKKRDRKRSHRLHIYVLRARRDLISIMKTKGTRTLLVMCVWTWTIIQNVTSIKFLYWKTSRKTKQMNHPKRRQKYKIGRRRRTNKTCRSQLSVCNIVTTRRWMKNHYIKYIIFISNGQPQIIKRLIRRHCPSDDTTLYYKSVYYYKQQLIILRIIRFFHSDLLSIDGRLAKSPFTWWSVTAHPSRY